MRCVCREVKQNIQFFSIWSFFILRVKGIGKYLADALPIVIRKGDEMKAEGLLQAGRCFFFCSIVFLLLFSGGVLASEKPVWVEAEGEASLGETDTPREVIERSRKDALGKALEQAAGLFLKSHTLVSNSQVVEDLIFASVKGEIKQSRILKAGWDPRDRTVYRTSIKALIKPVYPEKGEGLSAEVHLSKAVLKEGENVRIQFRTSADAYVYLFCAAADGSVTLLFPNSAAMDNKVAAKTAHEFPPAGSSIQLKAMLLPGSGKSAEERIKLIATRHKQDLIPLGFQEGVFQVYDSKSTGMISDLVRKLNRLEPGEWTEATAVYTLHK